MRRRRVIALLGGMLTGCPAAVRAQQTTLPIIGFLGSGSPETSAASKRAFLQGLGEAGFVDGQNALIVYRWANDRNDQWTALAADLVAHQVSVIATAGASPAALAAKTVTSTIPIVFQVGVDPVAMGLVSSLAQPGGNLTGVASLTGDLGPKRLEIIKEFATTTTIVAELINPTKPPPPSEAQKMQASALAMGLELHVVRAGNEREIDQAFATLNDLRATSLVMGPDPFLHDHSKQIAALATRQGLPVISPYREFPLAGGLMSYGASLSDQYRLVGIYTGRILKGAKPAELPVQQATKLELTINLKTARAFGLTFPLSLLGRADEVIE